MVAKAGPGHKKPLHFRLEIRQDNDCQVPFSPDYIRKVAAKGGIGKKLRSVKC